jgi:hypothetical protein
MNEGKLAQFPNRAAISLRPFAICGDPMAVRHFFSRGEPPSLFPLNQERANERSKTS